MKDVASAVAAVREGALSGGTDDFDTAGLRVRATERVALSFVDVRCFSNRHDRALPPPWMFPTEAANRGYCMDLWRASR